MSTPIFAPDARLLLTPGTTPIVAFSYATGAAQTAGAQVMGQVTLDPAAMVALTQPIIQPTFGPFLHPVAVGCYKDPAGATNAHFEVVVNQAQQTKRRPAIVASDCLGQVLPDCAIGVYGEGAYVPLAEAVRLKTRVVYCFDGSGLPIVPAGLRAWDIIAVELYRVVSESLANAILRWSANLRAVLSYWPHDIALVPQFYCMGGAPPAELWTVQETLDGLAALTALVNYSPRIKLIMAFVYDRANGMSAHPELLTAFDHLLAAQGSTADALNHLIPIPVIVVVPPPPPPPDYSGDVFAMLTQVKGTITHYGKVPSTNALFPTLFGLKGTSDGQIISVDSNGGLTLKPVGSSGANELFQIDGAVATIRPVNDADPFVYLIAVIDKLP